MNGGLSEGPVFPWGKAGRSRQPLTLLSQFFSWPGLSCCFTFEGRSSIPRKALSYQARLLFSKAAGSRSTCADESKFSQAKIKGSSFQTFNVP